MDYQKIVCWGDSQTFGARSYGCYPVYLARILNGRTRYAWHALNFSTNGHTARDLWFRLAAELPLLHDVHRACILIGANDVANGSPLDLFEEYYRQILIALHLHGIRVAHCGEIPPLWPDGHAFFPRETKNRRDAYNQRIATVVRESQIANLVRFEALTAEDFTDPVHFTESGNQRVAEAFADAIIRH